MNKALIVLVVGFLAFGFLSGCTRNQNQAQQPQSQAQTNVSANQGTKAKASDALSFLSEDITSDSFDATEEYALDFDFGSDE
jgi:hypothetical protein